MGEVKLGAAALEKAAGQPLLGALTLKPGEDIAADPLRLAVAVGIAQLDEEWDDPDGAKVAFG
jgi:hypothetical protein